MNRPIRFSSILVGSLFTLAVLFGTSGCDSGTSQGALDELAGEYTFATFRFTPDSRLLTPVNMLDTLVVTSTVLQLFSNSRYTLMYQFVGGSSKFIGGDVTLKDNKVTLKGSRDDDALYRSLLLTSETTLTFTTGSPDRLSASLDRRVNLESFSRRYSGLPSVDGKLELALRRK